jgi:hypothetical protein
MLQAFAVAPNRRHCDSLCAALKGELAVVLFDAAFHIQIIPPLSIADVVKRKIVLVGPEKRHHVKPLATTHYVPRRRLSLALSDHPVLDANILTGQGIWQRAMSPAAKICGMLVSR